MSAPTIVLESFDKERILVGKRFLAKESGYFRSIFFNHYSDSQHAIHRLPFGREVLDELISASMMVATNQVPTWSLAKACDLLTPVTYLQFDHLLPFIRNSIISQTEVGNLLKIFRYVYQRDVPLSQEIWKLILRHFNKLIETEEYLNMTENEFVTAMKSNTLNIESDKEVHVMQYYLHQHPNSLQTREIGFHYTGDGIKNPVVMDRVPGDVLIALGGWSSAGPTEIVEVYNPRCNIWVRGAIMEDERIAYHSFHQQSNKLVYAGGMNAREIVRSVKSFDLNKREWHTIGELKETRCYVSSASFHLANGKSQLMVIGGYNGNERLSSCELVEPENNWTIIRSMNKRRSDAAAVSLEYSSKIAIIGGFDGRHVHQDAEIYDVATDQWVYLNRRMQYARTGVCAVGLNTNVFLVAGGFNGSARLSTVEFYDTREGKWHLLPKMQTMRSNFALEHLNGEIYAVGGFDGLATTSSAEKFDMVAQRWAKLPDLTVSRSALRMIRLSDHEIIRPLVNFTSEL